LKKKKGSEPAKAKKVRVADGWDETEQQKETTHASCQDNTSAARNGRTLQAKGSDSQGVIEKHSLKNGEKCGLGSPERKGERPKNGEKQLRDE